MCTDWKCRKNPGSSVEVRRLIGAGEVAQAARLLQRQHQVEALCVRRDAGRGAELQLAPRCAPGGVYAGAVRPAGQSAWRSTLLRMLQPAGLPHAIVHLDAALMPRGGEGATLRFAARVAGDADLPSAGTVPELPRLAASRPARSLSLSIQVPVP